MWQRPPTQLTLLTSVLFDFYCRCEDHVAMLVGRGVNRGVSTTERTGAGAPRLSADNLRRSYTILPDHRRLLRVSSWQKSPDFLELRRFLEFLEPQISRRRLTPG